MRVILPFLAILLIGLPIVSSLSNEGSYFIYTGNISERIKTGTANVLIVGDSINSFTSTPRMPYGYIRMWKPNNWRGMITQSGSGVSDQGTTVSNEPTSLANRTTISPGQNYTWNGEIIRGWNVQVMYNYNFTRDASNLGTTIFQRIESDTYSSFSDDWMSGTNITLRHMYLSNSNSTCLRLRAILRNGTTTAAGGSPEFCMNQSIRGIYHQEFNFTNSPTGTTDSGAFLSYTNTINESLSNSQYFPIATRIFRNDISTGLQLGYIGDGGFTTRSHIEEGEYKSIEGQSWTTFYNNSALRQWINYTDTNTFIIWLGQNIADNEWNGVTTRNFTENMNSVIDRYITIYYQTNKTSDKPYFLLISTYDTNENNTRQLMQEKDLINITVNNTRTNAEVGLIKLREYVNITNGSYSIWNASYTGDGIHPNQVGALTFADYIWAQINFSFLTPNDTLNGIQWISDSYLVNNSSVDSNAISLANLGEISSPIKVYNLNDSLTYLSNFTVLDSKNIGAGNNNINITLPSRVNLTVLNHFNLTEGIARNGSPLWFSSSSTTLKAIASNLTDTINLSTSFNVESCSGINTISYISHTGTYSKTYNSSEYSCFSNIVTLNITGLETASGSNNLSISYFASSSSSTSESSESGSSPKTIIGADQLETGYKRIFYKGWNNTFILKNETHSLVLTNISNDFVIVSLSSEEIIDKINLGETKKFDLDSDEIYDLEIELNEINLFYSYAIMTIKAINESIKADSIEPERPNIPIPSDEEISILLLVLSAVLIAIAVILVFKLLKGKKSK